MERAKLSIEEKRRRTAARKRKYLEDPTVRESERIARRRRRVEDEGYREAERERDAEAWHIARSDEEYRSE